MTETEPAAPYAFDRSERAIYTELYFPKRVAYEGPIADALAESLNQRIVKNYLRDNIHELLPELRRYPELFDPRQYSRRTPRRRTNLRYFHGQ